MTQPKKATPLQLAIRLAIAESGKTRDHFDSQIRERTGKSGKPIYDIDRGKSVQPSLDTIQLIADVLGKPASYFLSAMSGRFPAGAPDRKGGYTPEPDIPPVTRHPLDDRTVALRQIDLGFSMGDGSDIDNYVDEGTIDFDANLLRSITRSPPDRLLVARGEGDSMFPTLLDSDLVVIDTAQRELNLQDRIWAVSVYGAGAIKRLRTVGKGRIEVRSDNATVGNREVDSDDIVLLGRVIWMGRRL